MARRLGMTALRAALGGVAGGLEGLSQQRKAAAAAARQAALDERQAAQDAAALRAEQRAAMKDSWVPASQFMGGGVAGGMDMPGATPRTPVARQTIGGQPFVLPEQAGVTEHRAGLMKKREERIGRTRMGAILERAGIAPEGSGEDFASLPASDRQVAENRYRDQQRQRAREQGGMPTGGGRGRQAPSTAPEPGPKFDTSRYSAIERAFNRAEEELRGSFKGGAPKRIDYDDDAQFAAARARYDSLAQNAREWSEELAAAQAAMGVRRPKVQRSGTTGSPPIRNAAEERQMALDAQQEIAEIQQDPELTPEEKAEAVRQINARMTQALRGMR
jgi:hypothetical protein